MTNLRFAAHFPKKVEAVFYFIRQRDPKEMEINLELPEIKEKKKEPILDYENFKKPRKSKYEFAQSGINEHYQCGPEENKQSAKID